MIQSFAAVSAFSLCKLRNGSTMSPLRIRRFGRSRQRNLIRKFASFASLAMLQRRIARRGHVRALALHASTCWPMYWMSTGWYTASHSMDRVYLCRASGVSL
eukprot:934022-Pleurochrysis_carterae.AAC.1